MKELSEQARGELGRFAEGISPEPVQGAVTWARIEAAIESEREAAAARSVRRRGRRAYRFAVGYLRRGWKPIVIAAIVGMALGPLVRGEIGGPGHLQLARDLIEQGEYRSAYNVLVDHSRLYKAKSGADERMGLALEALCGLKMYERAEDDLRRYLELNPESIHADRMDNLCPGGEPAPSQG